MAFCRVTLASVALSAAGSSSWPWLPDVGTHSFGQHRAILHLPSDKVNSSAVWAEVSWQRRPIPDASATNAVLTVASTGQIVTNALRAPIAGIPESEAVNWVFEPQLDVDEGWITNNGTESRSIVTACSGAYSTTPCWKVADGKFTFDYDTGEGWDAEPDKGTTLEWVEFDLGVAEQLERLGIYSVAREEDPHYPIHNPANIAILKRESPTDAWEEFFNGTASELATNVFSWRGSLGAVSARYVRLEIRSRHVASQKGAHSWLKEVQFGRREVPDRRVVTDYALYFMPYNWSGSRTGLSYKTKYDPISKTASEAWRALAGLTDAALADQSYEGQLPQATMVGLEAQTSFDSFEPMEVVARGSDREALLDAYSNNKALWFPENRRNQVRMFDVVPQRWIDAGPSNTIHEVADPGELLALQLGVWAAREDVMLDSSSISWSDFVDASGNVVITARDITCYNLGGRDYRGKTFAQPFVVQQGRVGALWFGVSVPSHAAPGILNGHIVAGNEDFDVTITVTSHDEIPNSGADDVWRMSRLAWLDSTLGIDRNITAGFSPVSFSVQDRLATVSLSGERSLTISSANGGDQLPLINSIAVKDQPVLSVPLSFAVQGVTWEAMPSPSVLQEDNMTVTFSQQTMSNDGSLLLNSTIVASYDGFIDVSIVVESAIAEDIVVDNAQLSFDVPLAASTFLMGLGLQGRNRTLMYPNGSTWHWSANKGGENQLWTGSVDAGLRLKLKGDDYDWESPLHMQSEAPKSWGGDVAGGTVAALPQPNGALRITASSGSATIHAQKPTTFKFDLLITPVKTLDTALHFRRDRYYQYGYNGHGSCQQIADMGTKVLNLHQGTAPNPYINYPFNEEAMKKQANFSQECKSLGVEKTKIYYTARELSNRCYEMPTLMALSSPQDHFFDDGTGGGPSWLMEHLGDVYHQRWSTGLPDGELDAAIADTSLTRWVNYYIAGLHWLSEHHPGTAAIDGLYLDEVSFDRATMQRMRKAVDSRREGSLFDLHSCNKYHCGVPSSPHACSALIYMAHFAFIDSLWFGEGFSSNYPPDQWLVEMSGIPFGLHAEQLSSPNLWRGMVFAEGSRPSQYLWAAWDSLELTLAGTRLVGWWHESVPVRSNNSNILVSVYMRPNKGCVLAIASWEESGSAQVELEIDWNALGMDPQSASISAPSIKNFQPAATLSPHAPTLSVDAKKGWLLDVRSPSLYV